MTPEAAGSDPARTAGHGRLAAWLLWAATAVVVFVLGGAGAGKFVNYHHEVDLFAGWGYPAWFVLVVASGELLVALTVLWPRSAFYGACLGVLLMTGAIATHLRVPEVGLIPLAAPTLLLCAVIAWGRWPERLCAPRAAVA